jgi:hypothetical protein
MEKEQHAALPAALAAALANHRIRLAAALLSAFSFSCQLTMRTATVAMSELLGGATRDMRVPQLEQYHTTSTPTPYSWTKGSAGSVKE